MTGAIVTRGTWQEMPIEIADYPVGRSKNLEPQAVLYLRLMSENGQN
jgi:hypothetical protein